jgi:hypothetical protein
VQYAQSKMCLQSKIEDFSPKLGERFSQFFKGGGKIHSVQTRINAGFLK